MDNTSQSPPRISVILITPDNFETIRQTVRHLAAQTIAGDLELLIGIKSRADLNEVTADLKPLHSWRVVEIPRLASIGAAKVLMVNEARAPFVIFAEDHSFPDREWAAALVAAHGSGHAAAAPQVQNGNPGTMLSWADLFLGFGPWIAPHAGGVRDDLPWHNTGYDREFLLSLGDDLHALLDNEGLLYPRIRAQGRTLFLIPAVTRHMNMSRLCSFLRLQYHGGRSFGGNRAHSLRWPWYKRLVYVGGAPLVPLLRLRRTLKLIHDAGRSQELMPKVLPALFVGLCAHATGEAVGTAFGPGNAVQQKANFEFHRDHHVREAEKAAWSIA